MFCTKCGKQIQDGSNFCIGCGAKLAHGSDNSSQSVASISVGLRSKKIVIAALLVVGLIGLAAAGFGYFKKQYSDNGGTATKELQNNAPDKQAQKLDGYDLIEIIGTTLPKQTGVGKLMASPLNLIAALNGCKLKGEGGDWKGKCVVYSDGKYLVDENVENDRRVEIRSSGPRAGIEYINFSATYPNSIDRAILGPQYRVTEAKCPVVPEGHGEFDFGLGAKIYQVVAADRSFVALTSVSSGSGGSWGGLRIYTSGDSVKDVCESLKVEQEAEAERRAAINRSKAAQKQTAVQQSSSAAVPRTPQVQQAPQPQSSYYEAILSCGMGGNNLNVLACFAKDGYGSDTELEIQNGGQYGMYKVYNISNLGNEDSQGLHIRLSPNFSIKAQNSNSNLILTLTIRDQNGRVVFQKSASRYGVISVRN